MNLWQVTPFTFGKDGLQFHLLIRFVPFFKQLPTKEFKRFVQQLAINIPQPAHQWYHEHAHILCYSIIIILKKRAPNVFLFLRNKNDSKFVAVLFLFVLLVYGPKSYRIFLRKYFSSPSPDLVDIVLFPSLELLKVWVVDWLCLEGIWFETKQCSTFCFRVGMQ